MRIDSASIQMGTQRTAFARRSTSESLRTWVGQQGPDFEARDRTAARRQPAAESARKQAMEALAAKVAQATAQAKGSADASADADLTDDPKTQLIRSLIEKIFGIKIKVLSGKDLEACQRAAGTPPQAAAAASAPPKAGFGVEYDRLDSYTEAETTTMTAGGTINTADGKQISFDLTLDMSRSFTAEASFSLRAGDAVRKDPLVVNFGGTAAQLTDTKFDFDIDADGTKDQISFVRPGSGFLALDSNQDGTVNDGSELFGARSGDGFADLRGYDADHNGWIDEGDPVYSQLQVWTKDAQGADQLQALSQSGVGAIYLDSVGTPFELKDEANRSQGDVRASGIYAREDGSVGTVQQVDLAV